MIDARERDARQAGRNVAQHCDAVFLQAEGRDRRGRRHQPDQAAGHARIPLFAAERHGRDPEPDQQRERLGLVQMGRERSDAFVNGAADARHAQNGRRLREDDVDRDAGQKAGDDRLRQQIGDPAEPDEAARDQDRAHQERERGGEPRIVG